MTTVLITGANKGIGLELVKCYVGAGDHVIACCRDPGAAGALKELAAQHATLSIEALDIAVALWGDIQVASIGTKRKVCALSLLG